MSVQTIQLSSESDVIALLQRVLNDEVDSANISIELKNFTHFNMHVSGDKFHQTITPSVMKGFIDLQAAIYKSFSLIRYNDAIPNKLTQEDRSALELEVKVIDGSSGFEVDWDKVLNNLIDKTVGKMEGKHVLVAVLAAILLFAGYSTYQLHITNQTEIRKEEISLKKDEQERAERLETIKLLAKPNPEAAKVIEKAALQNADVKTMKDEAKNVAVSFIKSVREGDQIEFQNAVALSGEAAQEISITPKSRWQPERLDDWYFVKQVDSSHAAKRKIRIRRASDNKEFLAVLVNDTLDQKNLNLIQDAEWEYKKIYLKVEASSLNGEYKKAVILDATRISNA